MGFFGGIGKALGSNTGRNVLGNVGDALMQLGGLQPTYGPAMERQRLFEEQRNKPHRFQNNNGDLVEINPTTGEQRVLYQDQPKPVGPPEWEQTAQWLEGQGRAEEAADIRAKARLMTETYVDPATGAINMKGVRASDLLQGSSQPQAAEMTATNPQTGEKVRLNPQTGQWEPMGGAGPQTPPMFP